MEIRVHKLLIMVGEEGAQLEARDFTKLKEVIVDEYLADNSQGAKNYLIEILSKTIRGIAQKHHFYAGLTAAIAKCSTELSTKIIENVLATLETDLNNGQVAKSINVINFLSEIMNISLLNSLTFLNILEDILNAAEKQQNNLAKKNLISILIKTMPLYGHSLNEKLFHDFKKYIEKVYKQSDSQEFCEYQYSLYTKAKLKNHTLMPNLHYDFSNLSQYNSKLKLKIDCQSFKDKQLIEYFPQCKSQNIDELYNEFKHTQGRYNQAVIEQLIQCFSANGPLLTWKIILFIKSQNNIYALKHLVEFLIMKSIKSKQPMVEYGILINLIKDQQTSQAIKSIEENLVALFHHVEEYQLNIVLTLTKLFSMLINNWVGEFQWERLTFEEEDPSKKKILLQIIFQKLFLLSDKFILPKAFEKYEAPKPLFNEEEYSSVDELQLFQKFNQALKSKTEASILVKEIKNEKDYEIFLEALLRRTSLSQTHLNILSQRYSEILLRFREYDWTLINKVRNIFQNSFFHRQFYLKFFLQKEYLTYLSYVNYIGELQDKKSQQEMLWIKIQLTELNQEFGQKVASKTK